MSKYLFITGGVVSSLGKGITAAAIASLLKAMKYKVKVKKLDPYLNFNPGTMNPLQHGEVFVTEDGYETDLDLGHYERFTNDNSDKYSNITSGYVYAQLLKRERMGKYLGMTLQVVPHLTDMIKEFITHDNDKYDFIICEIGGTVGDIESLPFLEALRQIAYKLTKKNTLFLHLTLIPYLPTVKEFKTKPTQHSIKELRSIGIQADILACRSEKTINNKIKEKIAWTCNLDINDVITISDLSSIYNCPAYYHNQGLTHSILSHFNIDINHEAANLQKTLDFWNNFVTKLQDTKKPHINIAIVGKYIELGDSYCCLVEAIKHASVSTNIKFDITWVDSRDMSKIEEMDSIILNNKISAIIVPGGFGVKGLEVKSEASQIARKYNLPYLGICLGMQTAILDIASINNIKTYSSQNEQDNSNDSMLIGLYQEEQTKIIEKTMRLGAKTISLKENSLISKIYNSDSISERHRHKYKINTKYKPELEKVGLLFSAHSDENGNYITEAVEYTKHPWFIGVQYHPEFKSRPMSPHPIFISLFNAALEYAKKNNSITSGF